MTKKRIAIICCALCLTLISSVFSALAHAEITVSEISKYGNLVLSISATDFLALGYEHGDILTVQLAGAEYDMPVCTNYTDVDNGSPVCRAYTDSETGEDLVILAICMGDLATDAGIAVKTPIDEEPGFRWDYADGLDAPLPVSIAMKQQGGYAAEYRLRQLVRTNVREDYAHLDDGQFANFRPVCTAGMGENVLFRSSSPVNSELGRSAFADAALGEAGVRTIVNLADTRQGMESYPGYAETFYASCNSIALSLSVDVKADDFCQGFARGLRFMIDNEGPYLIHCTEGKDRAGFASAVLECLMGASADEVIADYMTTFFNYYGVEPGTEQYDEIARSNLCALLAEVFEIDGIDGDSVDLSREAEEYLSGRLGLTGDEIALLKQKLGG